MVNRCLLALGVALTVGSMAHAATPLSPAIIGEVDGILSSCSKIDPRDEDKFEKLRRSLIPAHVVRDRNHQPPHGVGHSDDRDDDRKVMEKNPDYRANFIWMQTVFKEMAPAEALKLCKAAV
jgi:hypothetical protein